MLDGLDESASPSADWRPSMRILGRLNTDYGARGEDGTRPLVLTCRTSEYRDLPDLTGESGLSRRLAGAPVVVMKELTQSEILEYLDEQARAYSRRVGELSLYLTAGTNPAVALAMATPLVIALAVRTAVSGGN